MEPEDTKPDPPDPENLPKTSHRRARTAAAKGQTGADDALATALAAGKTVAEAATTAGVSEATAYRRQRDEAFIARVRELRAGFVTAAAGRLASTMTTAADVLGDLLGSASENVRLRAADRLLEIGVKVVDLQELQQRVEDLERRLSEEDER
ncbi:Uncultured bacterium genome assembly Metasoil_fosmids_resub OS=uncultured bacterium PE=4 SV=1 [Gemmata massiliana]|uniref:Uncharacterized protein n=1 Tax=Gemmata massiliana TaxID=1210884 RepID=A0A6P2CZC5_9BACT|nr:hypothetical protein [Gemmata massiliana]VTR92512.1 Uncultured bacterium genome assembly Metasoil_fosmids_resub OS=uncultured bacterium PE=4 SV=1 [Gemmata massiliana]